MTLNDEWAWKYFGFSQSDSRSQRSRYSSKALQSGYKKTRNPKYGRFIFDFLISHARLVETKTTELLQRQSLYRIE
jgi:hypothetical protein